ncbi:MAG: hypothetical protein CL398_07705 [Acidiferrobacteraceae bacterium]|nr:hypothetical protein [Acidiferrobacteraceae bacterium]
MKNKKLPKKANSDDITAFLQKVKTTPVEKITTKHPRLIFSLDATASREPMWDSACHIQAQMFKETLSLGGLDIQLAYYRGFLEFETTPWANSGESLLSYMGSIRCAAGQTQIAKILDHTISESSKTTVKALVFVGDAMEEDPIILNSLAGKLGIVGVPIFVFQDGFDVIAERSFRDIARLSKGAYCQFDTNSVHKLKDLLCAVAVFVAGGHKALNKYTISHGTNIAQLTHQLAKTR